MEHQLSVEALRHIDAACDSFERDWRAGKQPRIEDYIRRCEVSIRTQLLVLLQGLQQELILQQCDQETAASIPVQGVPVQTPSREPSSPRPASPPPWQATSLPEESVERTADWEKARVVFRVVAGPHEGMEFIYTDHNTLLVGRSSQAQLQVSNDPHFSRHHFRLEINPPCCYMMDLRSRNGTFVNGTRVADQFLKDGDVVSGGRTKMKVSIFTPAADSNRSPLSQTETLDLTPEEGLPLNIASANRAAQNVLLDDDPRPRSAVPPRRELPPLVPMGVPAAAPQDGSEPPQITGYQIIQQIGAGDLGRMYRAVRLASGEECALKVISPASRIDEKTIQSFLREASILNQLQHPHIVRFMEMGASGSDLFLCTEFLSVVSWQKLTSRWPTAKKIRIACALTTQILSALEYAHARSLVHRDVKPGNVLLHRSDGKLAAKLADFGLAKQYTTAGMSQVTRDGDVIGSLPYMSPEQFINSREAKPSCDIYSAGATLYWMLTGHEPIAMENHPCKFLAILEDPPVPLAQRCPDVPAPLAIIVHRALEKTPEKRFASAAEMRQQLRAFSK